MLQRRFLLQVRVGIKKELRRHRVWGYGGETDMILLLKEVIVIFRHSFYCSQHTDSRVAQWKRAGPITQRSVDRNYALLTFLGSDFNFNIEKTDSSIFQNLPNPVRMAEWSKAPDSRYTALLP